MNKRQVILVSLAALVIAGVLGGLYYFNREAPAPAATTAEAEAIGPDEPHAQGNAQAKAVLIEYAALTFPWCALFNNKMVPTLKEKYIATGKVHYVLRLIPLDVADAKADALAACMGKDKYFDAVDLLYHRQDEWGPEQMGEHGLAPNAQPKTDAGLMKMGRAMGLDEEKSRACLTGKNAEDAFERLRRVAEHGLIRYGVSSTPTLILNGQLVKTPRTPEELAQLLDPVLEGK
jgi:protein-disulfide isomerase